MTLSRLIFRSLLHYRAANLAVLAGVAVAAAVLVGSLVVGDSVNGSLRDLALERIGGLRLAIERPQPFSAEVVGLAGMPAAFMAEGSATSSHLSYARPHVQIIGCRRNLFPVLAGAPGFLGPDLRDRDAALNARLAADLHVQIGDSVLITLPKSATAPVQSIFGRKGRADTILTARVIVKTILPDAGVGAFTLRADRPAPRTIFVSLDWLSRELGFRAPMANTMVWGERATIDSDLSFPRSPADNDLTFELTPRFLALRHSAVTMPPAIIDRIKALADAEHLRFEPRSVYLANTIAMTSPEYTSSTLVPYSLMAGVDNLTGMVSATTEPLPAALGDNDIVLNEWAERALAKTPGYHGLSHVRVQCYVAGPRGEVETTQLRFAVRGVVKMQGEALARDYVPEVKGMTDVKTMSGWNAPFPIDQRMVHKSDEDYWDTYRATPKAFVSPAVIRRLWTHGLDPQLAKSLPWVTGVRIYLDRPDGTRADPEKIRSQRLSSLTLADMGFTVRDVRAEALAAANASTDFGALFLSMSFFLVAAAALLIFLLMRLTIDRRAGEIGLLLAQGFTRRRAARVLVGEASAVSVLGVAVGIPLGVGYAALILWALKHGWSGAVADFPLSLHVTALSVTIGAASGLAIALTAILLSTRMLRRLPPLVLLSGWQAIAAEVRARRGPSLLIAIACFLAAGVSLVLILFRAISATAAYASAGSLLLVGGLALFASIVAPRAKAAEAGTLSLRSLALRSLSRHRARSLLTVGLIACATLVIVTVAAFHRDPTGDISRYAYMDPEATGYLSSLLSPEPLPPNPAPKSGTGGFDLIVRTDVPIFVDLNTKEGRKTLNFSDNASNQLARARIYSLRESRGDDISCLNMQRSKTPRIVGVPDAFIARGGFRFSQHAPLPPYPNAEPWALLATPQPGTTDIPAFADADTAEWQMHVGLGDNLTVPVGATSAATLRIAGLMPGSIFAGELVISERAFVRSFGGDGGYRLFLVECPRDAVSSVAGELRSSLGDFGVDVQLTTEALAAYARVQNTYLSAFQTLGGLGLALGTFGVVAVLLRNVLERRREIGMMLALGFTVRRVRALVVAENAILLLVGVAVGAISALVASGPQIVSSGTSVPWLMLAATLAGAVAVGLIACDVAARSAVGREVIEALRSE